MAKRVALVDGDEAVRASIAELLSARGWIVEQYGTIGSAISRLVTYPPVLMILEVDLEDGCGLNLIDLVKDKEGGRVPAIVLSSRSDEQDVMRGFAAGAVDYLMKPFRAEELVAKCRVHMSRSSRLEIPSENTPEVPTVEGLAFGRYRLIRELGRGGYGVVYMAEDTESDAVVALKISTPPKDDKQAPARFVRETHTLSTVLSPHVVKILDMGFVRDRLYYAMEHVGGPSLHRMVMANGPVSETEVRPIAHGLLRALVAVEAAGLIHRDIKPSNVILRDGDLNRVVLVDFGLAKQARDKELTKSGGDILLGTPSYMAPEVIRGDDHDIRGDLWAAAVTMRFALAGSEVHPNLQGFKLLDAVTASPVPPPPVRVSPGFGFFLRILSAHDPKRRPQNAAAALKMLEAVCLELPSAERLPWSGQQTKKSRSPGPRGTDRFTPLGGVSDLDTPWPPAS